MQNFIFIVDKNWQLTAFVIAAYPVIATTMLLFRSHAVFWL